MLPANKNNFKSILKELSSIVRAGTAPADVIRATLKLWAAQITPGVTTPSAQVESLLKLGTIVSFATWLGESDILTGAFWLSSAYASLITVDQRKLSAMYFTPPYLSNRMLDNAGEALFEGKVVDPACGGAAFLAPAAQRIVHRLEGLGQSSVEIVSYLEANLYGADTDSFLCELSETFLRMILARHLLAIQRKPKFKILCGDGLSAFESEAGTFQLILSNPPYRKMARDEVLKYAAVHESIITGQPNLYALFISRSVKLAAIEGKAILLTPMSFLSGSSFSKLRAFIADKGHVRQLDLIHNKKGVFLGAEQDAVVTVWNKTRMLAPPTLVYSLSPAEDCKYVGEVLLTNPERSWPIPRKAEDAELLRLLDEDHAHLADYGYKAKTGAIVVHRDTRHRFSRVCDAQKSKCFVPLIWSRDIDQKGILSLRPSTECPDRFISLETIKSSACISRPAIALQRVTSADQAKRLFCAPVPEDLYMKYGGVAGENHVCFLESQTDTPNINPSLLSDILRTEVMDRLFRCISGATNVSVYELNQLPMPDIEILKEALKMKVPIENAVRLGLGLTELAPRIG